MLTEDEARDLLTSAAATIEVSPDAPEVAERSRRPLWPIIGAAAAVLAVVATAAVVTLGGGSAPSPAPAPATLRVPSVFAYDEASATRLLEAEGLTVDVRRVPGCEALGRAIGTAPIAGTAVEPGARVRLEVSDPTLPMDGVCFDFRGARESAWTLLDFANGRGDAPAFADEVTSYVNGTATTLAGEQAAAIDSWSDDSGLTALHRASGHVLDMGDRLLVPGLVAVDTSLSTDLPCDGQELPPSLASRDSLAVWMDYPDPALPQKCFVVNVFSTGGRIDAVVLRTGGPEGQAAEHDLELDLAERAAGAAGKAWVEFARGGAAPRFAEQVDVLFGDAHQRYLTADQAADRTSWDLCPRWMSAPCEMSNLSPVHVINHEDDRIVRTHLPPESSCFRSTGELPGYLSQLAMVRLDQPEAASCRDTWAVQVWVDQDDAITAVNLLLGSPPASP